MISQSTSLKVIAASASSDLLRFSRLIIDNDVTNHITFSPNFFVNSNENIILPPVIMSSGEQTPITFLKTLPLNLIISLKNILVMPSCKIDVMSV